MKIYTKTGDSGSTGLFGGPRVPKDDARIESYGTVDELNAAIGMVRSLDIPSPIDRQLESIQHDLFSLGAELATPHPEAHQMRIIGPLQIERIEQWIDGHQRELPELKNFILPSGSLAVTSAHLARAICRRAERRVIRLDRQRDDSAPAISPHLIVYLNRLSDLLFVLARAIGQAAGDPETAWQRPRTET